MPPLPRVYPDRTGIGQHCYRSNRPSPLGAKGHSPHRSNTVVTPEAPGTATAPEKKWKRVSGKVAAAKAAANFVVGHRSPAKRNHVSARVRLHQHIEEIRANPVAVAMIKKKASAHRKNAAREQRKIRLWNEERAKIREKTLTIARRRWEDLHSCRDLNVSANQWTVRKWATILSISKFVRDAPKIIKEGKAARLRIQQRRRRRKRRQVRARRRWGRQTLQQQGCDPSC